MKSAKFLLLAIALSTSVTASVALSPVTEVSVVENEMRYDTATFVAPAPTFQIVQAYSFDSFDVYVISAPTGVEVKSVSNNAQPVGVVMEVPVRDTGDTYANCKRNLFSYKSSTPKWLLHCSIRQC
jgi:hypothetical protein